MTPGEIVAEADACTIVYSPSTNEAAKAFKRPFAIVGAQGRTLGRAESLDSAIKKAPRLVQKYA